MVPQSPEPGAHDKNARLFTITLLLTITIYIKNIKKEKKKEKFATINPELKYKIFLKPTGPNIKNSS